MLKFSPEELGQLNLTEQDSKNMKSLAESSEEVLQMTAEEAARSLRFASQERIFEEAKRILEKTDIIQRDIVHEAKGIINEDIPEQPTIVNEQLDNSSDYYSNVWKGSFDELWFKTIMEGVPDIGISFDDLANHPNHLVNQYCVVIKATPYKTDRQFLYNLEKTTIYKVLTKPWWYQAEGKQLEEDGVLPIGTTDRILVHSYQSEIRDLIKNSDKSNPKTEQQIKEYEEKLAQLGDIEPFTEEEAQEVMRQFIREEYEKKILGNDGEELEI